jgi:hypothetical protein
VGASSIGGEVVIVGGVELAFIGGEVVIVGGVGAGFYRRGGGNGGKGGNWFL